jgi:hypothetical protein
VAAELGFTWQTELANVNPPSLAGEPVDARDSALTREGDVRLRQGPISVDLTLARRFVLATSLNNELATYKPEASAGGLSLWSSPAARSEVESILRTDIGPDVVPPGQLEFVPEGLDDGSQAVHCLGPVRKGAPSRQGR